jgi:hypothetical protein
LQCLDGSYPLLKKAQHAVRALPGFTGIYYMLILNGADMRDAIRSQVGYQSHRVDKKTPRALATRCG